jgi:hypothetical protein
MKKFGTPIGAGPGSDSENVGFDVWGTPLPLGSEAVGEVLLGFFAWLLRFLALVEGACPWLEDFSGEEEVGCGVVLDEFVVVVFVVPGPAECEGEVEVELEVVEEELVELVELDELEELEEVVVVLELDELEELVAGAHVMDSVATTPLTGRFSDDRGVLGGTSTLNVSVTPPTSVTVTVHGSAEATGIAASPRTTKMATASDSTARSRRLIVKLVRPLLRPSMCASHAWNCSTSCSAGGHATDWYGALQFRTEGVDARVTRGSARAHARTGIAPIPALRARRRVCGAPRCAKPFTLRFKLRVRQGGWHQRAPASR